MLGGSASEMTRVYGFPEPLHNILPRHAFVSVYRLHNANSVVELL